MGWKTVKHKRNERLVQCHISSINKQKNRFFNIKIKDIYQFKGGQTVFQGRHLSSVLAEVYPDFDWKPWKFSRIPKSVWENKTVHREFMDSVAKELKIKDKSDWYNVNAKVKINIKKFH